MYNVLQTSLFLKVLTFAIIRKSEPHEFSFAWNILFLEMNEHRGKKVAHSQKYIKLEDHEIRNLWKMGLLQYLKHLPKMKGKLDFKILNSRKTLCHMLTLACARSVKNGWMCILTTEMWPPVFQPEHAGNTQSKYYLQYFQIGKTIESIML